MSTTTTKPHVETKEMTVPAGAMSEIKQLGICSTCVNQGTCLFLKASSQPVWFCDEFTDHKAGEEEPKAAPVIEPAPAEHYGEAQGVGLCLNCEARTDCMHRRPGEPVWDCEDYR